MLLDVSQDQVLPHALTCCCHSFPFLKNVCEGVKTISRQWPVSRAETVAMSELTPYTLSSGSKKQFQTPVSEPFIFMTKINGAVS